MGTGSPGGRPEDGTGAGEAAPDEPIRPAGEAWAYHWEARRRPFVHPWRTPGGVVLTQDAPADHPWHHGLWFTIKYVNGENFWEEWGDYGVLRHDGPPVVRPLAGGRTEVAGDLRWVRPDRSTVVLDEHRRLTHVPMAGDAWAIDVDVALVPRVDVVLDRTPFTTWGGYGGLTLRGRPDHHDTRLLLAHGVRGAQVLGERSPWCDLSGPVGPGAADDPVAGVLLLDHPANGPRPVTWYATTRGANYGTEGWSNFVNAALLWRGARSVAAGEVLRLRYRAVAHDGWFDAERCAELHAAWAAEPVEPPAG